MAEVDYNHKAKELLDVIMSYARLDFEPKANLDQNGDVFDAISAGVNMLGEELKSSTVSLKEKEFLLREVHHRVKNNLQIINSLLSLQSDFVTNEKEFNALVESRNRIKAMSIVHEMLYAGNNISSIGLKEYVASLTQQISFSFTQPHSGIQFQVEIPDEVNFDIDTMIPLGLIMNEVMTNSLKYAFPDKKGEIKIAYDCRNNQCIIKISDNGVGYKGDLLSEENSKFGIMLIKILAEQLNANVQVNSTKGVEYTLTYSK